MMITPYRRFADLPETLTTEDCINIFEERIYGWHLHIAEQLVMPIKQENGNIVDKKIIYSEYEVLQIIMSYFETIAKYHDGFNRNGESGQYFRRGIRMCFGDADVPEGREVDEVLDALYNRVRNPLYHTTSTMGIEFASQPFLIIGVTGNSQINLNLDNIVTILIRHLRDYCDRLRNPDETELRANFCRRFEFDMQPPSPIFRPQLTPTASA